MKKILKDKDNDFKSSSLTSFGRIAHWICMHSMLPIVGSYQEVNDHDLLVFYCLWRKIPLSLPHLIINHMIKAMKPNKSTFSVPYGLLMTLVFRHFKVIMEDKARDEEVLTWGRRML